MTSTFHTRNFSFAVERQNVDTAIQKQDFLGHNYQFGYNVYPE